MYKEFNNKEIALIIPIILIFISIYLSINYFIEKLYMIAFYWGMIFLFSNIIIYKILSNPKFQKINLNDSLINNHLEINNNLTNYHFKQHNNHVKEKKKNDDSTTNKKTLINLTEQQINKIYNFFVDNDLLADVNMKFKEFEENFLNKPLRVNMEGTVLREFYDKLVIQENIFFKDNDSYLSYFINSKNNSYYKKSTFNKQSNYKSKLTDEINELFSDFK